MKRWMVFGWLAVAGFCFGVPERVPLTTNASSGRVTFSLEAVRTNLNEVTRMIEEGEIVGTDSNATAWIAANSNLVTSSVKDALPSSSVTKIVGSQVTLHGTNGIVMITGDTNGWYDAPLAMGYTSGINMQNTALYGALDPTNGVMVGDRDYNDGRYVQSSGTTSTGGAIGVGAFSLRGGAIGESAIATLDGGAVGYSSMSGGGGAVGNNAYAATGGAIGLYARETNGGGAVGSDASATSGGAVGFSAVAKDGFSGGFKAVSTAGAVQLGWGYNTITNSLQFRSYQICDENGNIPAARMTTSLDSRYVTNNSPTIYMDGGNITISNGAFYFFVD